MRVGLVRVGLAVFAFTAACDDPPGRAWLVERPRVLAARVSAMSEPARASIAPAEAMRITWLVVGPNAPPRAAWAAAVCAAPAGRVADPRCEGVTAPNATGTADGSGEVVMDLAAPPASALGDAEEMLVVASFCEGATPALDPTRFAASCAGGGDALLASVRVRLAGAGRNQNPDIAPDAVRFDDAIVSPPSAPAAGGPCTPGLDAPPALAGSGHAFVFRLRGDEREPNETMLLTSVVTAGELDRAFSSVEPAEPIPRDVTIPWTAPVEVPNDGRLVEAFFVLRDGRGGSAFARRTVCVRR